MVSSFPPLGGLSILIFFRKIRINKNILKILKILSNIFSLNKNPFLYFKQDVGLA